MGLTVKYKIDAKKWLVKCGPPIIFVVFLIWLEDAASPRFDSVFDVLKDIGGAFIVLFVFYKVFVARRLPSLKALIFHKKESVDDSYDD